MKWFQSIRASSTSRLPVVNHQQVSVNGRIYPPCRLRGYACRPADTPLLTLVVIEGESYQRNKRSSRRLLETSAPQTREKKKRQSQDRARAVRSLTLCLDLLTYSAMYVESLRELSFRHNRKPTTARSSRGIFGVRGMVIGGYLG